ncbi:unnamed protein product, partial [Effrenium voratum]
MGDEDNLTQLEESVHTLVGASLPGDKGGNAPLWPWRVGGKYISTEKGATAVQEKLAAGPFGPKMKWEGLQQGAQAILQEQGELVSKVWGFKSPCCRFERDPVAVLLAMLSAPKPRLYTKFASLTPPAAALERDPVAVLLAMLSDISHCLWAFATARVEHEAVFKALVAQAARKANSFTSQALANTTWACAKMSAEAARMVEAATTEALRRPLRTWEPQALVTLCWSSGAAGIAFGRLLGPLTEELYRRPDDFNDKDLATLVFALKGWWPREQLHLRDAAMLRVKTEASRRDLPITADMLRRYTKGDPASEEDKR